MFVATGHTRGGCLSLRNHDGADREEVIFSYMDRVPELDAKVFRNVLLNFIETATLLRDQFMVILRSHVSADERVHAI